MAGKFRCAVAANVRVRAEIFRRAVTLGRMQEVQVRYAVKRAATGLGLFASRPIAAGRRIIEYVGPILTSEEVERRRGRYFFSIDEEYAIDGSARANLARYVNHSCRPNAEAFVTGKRIWIWSKRAIEPGEQITIDYGTEYFDDYIKPVGCKCEPCSAESKKESAKSKKKAAGSP
jgi:SET domain-containing protein